jgi:hypothetical protein
MDWSAPDRVVRRKLERLLDSSQRTARAQRERLAATPSASYMVFDLLTVEAATRA